MHQLTFTGKITDDGKLHILNRKNFDKLIAGSGWVNVELIVRRKKKRRSLSQNNYMFGVVLPLVAEGIKEAWGEELSIDEVHSFCKIQFNSREVVNKATGEVSKVPLTTTELSTTDFMAYVESISKFASEYLNVAIPLPNEQVEIDYEAHQKNNL